MRAKRDRTTVPSVIRVGQQHCRRRKLSGPGNLKQGRIACTGFTGYPWGIGWFYRANWKNYGPGGAIWRTFPAAEKTPVAA